MTSEMGVVDMGEYRPDGSSERHDLEVRKSPVPIRVWADTLLGVYY
jgi:hypothetical protein